MRKIYFALTALDISILAEFNDRLGRVVIVLGLRILHLGLKC